MTDRTQPKLLFISPSATSIPHAAAMETALADGPRATAVLTGPEALGDWTTDAPGVRRKITLDDLPKPFDTRSANNFPQARPPARRGDAACAQGLSGVRIRHRPAATLARSSPPRTATSSSPRACPAASSSCATPTATARPRRARTSPPD